MFGKETLKDSLYFSCPQTYSREYQHQSSFMTVHMSKYDTHLSNKLDDLDKNVKGHVPRHNATTPFGKQSGGDGRQTAERRKTDKRKEMRI